MTERIREHLDEIEQRRIREQLEAGLHLIPPHMRDDAIGYWVNRIRPGDFMAAILSNDLMGAAARADSSNQRRFYEWCVLLYNHVPVGSYGSRENYEDWLGEESD